MEHHYTAILLLAIPGYHRYHKPNQVISCAAARYEFLLPTHDIKFSCMCWGRREGVLSHKTNTHRNPCACLVEYHYIGPFFSSRSSLCAVAFSAKITRQTATNRQAVSLTDIPSSVTSFRAVALTPATSLPPYGSVIAW